MNPIAEKARTVFTRNSFGTYTAIKSRRGDVIRSGIYSEMFVNYYARLNLDTVILKETY